MESAATASEAACAAPDTFYARYGKRLLDLVVAVVLAVVLAPMMVLCATVVLLTLGRPVLFVQPRVGMHGRVFGMFKFRTMTPDRRGAAQPVTVDRRLTHKHPNDPRLTPVGRLLRRFSLDELPQLINVIRGDMSLVGPRPELESVLREKYEPWQLNRHVVRPGLTGLWQVTIRHGGDMHLYTEADLAYIAAISFLRDLRLLVMTVPAVLGRRPGV